MLTRWLLLLVIFGQTAVDAADVDPAFAAAKSQFLLSFRKQKPPDRAAAVTALAAFPHRDSIDLLLKKGCADSDLAVRQAARQALRQITTDEALRKPLFDEWKRGIKKPVPHWADLLRVLVVTTDESQREAIVEGLNTVLTGPNADLRPVIEIIDDFVRQTDEEAWQVIKLFARVKLFQTKFAYRRTIIQAAAQIPNKDVVNLLLEALPESRGLIQADIVQALTRITGQKYQDRVADWKTWWQMNEAQFVYPVKLPPVVELNDPKVASYYGIPICAKRIVFVLDTSGSMRGEPIVAAKKALLATIEALPSVVSFDVIMFNREISVWRGQLVPASRAAKDDVAQLVRQRALGGGTATFAALRAAFDLEPEAIYLLSDGEPTDGGALQIVDAMSHHNRIHRVSLHTIGVVTTRGEEDGLTQFMAPLAEHNWGEFRLVE